MQDLLRTPWSGESDEQGKGKTTHGLIDEHVVFDLEALLVHDGQH
jgi:hypothetical protein